MSLPAARTPSVAIARVLRGLGLTQGRGCDFRVTGEYRNGERVGTCVLVLTRHAHQVVADRADDIERLAGESGYAFRVSVRYFGKSRPTSSVANYGSRVREAPPAPEEPAPCPVQEAPAPEPGKAPLDPVADGSRYRARQGRRAAALGWSERQAWIVKEAALRALIYDRRGVLRNYPRPGTAGPVVDEARLGPLVKAGFLVITEPDGPGSKRVSVTADGSTALYLWRVCRPAPAAKDRKEEREPLRPLVGGEHAASLARSFEENDRLRKEQAAVVGAAIEELHAWEERDERLYGAWAQVAGITHRLGRPLPAGWVPTEEEAAEHRLDPAVVAELHAEAACPLPRPHVPRLGPVLLAEAPQAAAVADEREQLSLFAAPAT